MTRLFLALFLFLPGFLQSGEKNVLFIVADDLNCAIGPYGDKNAITPNLDRLAGRGMTFLNAYCQQAVCNPSRSSFLTGRYPDDTGVDDLRKSFRTALPDVITLPQAFLSAGYFTQCAGKIFHNMGETKDRQSWSVDEYLFEGTHAADTVFAQLPKGENPPKYKAPVSEALNVPDTAYRDGRITEYAVEAIRRVGEKGKPFFLAVGYWRPHLPFVAPQKYWDLYDADAISGPDPSDPPKDVPAIALHPNREVHGYGLVPDGPVDEDLTKHLRHGYYASISFLDAQVGQLLDALDRSEQAENTIVVFTSDHGFHIGEHGLWAKTTNFELDARVPLIIADPSQPDSHALSLNSLAELVDLIPTLTELAGVPTPPGQQGDSLAPLFTDAFAPVNEYAFTQHQHPFYGKSPATHWGYSVRSLHWRYTEWWNIKTGEIDERELYDHKNDSGETRNVVAAHPDIAKELSEVLQKQFGK
ncbi:MAG: sulfatase [Verrucomicrobiales bacterium]|nr:sulfatase [Verrucomicrobiales bacterium]